MSPSRPVAIAIAGVLLLATVVGLAAADHPRPGTEGNGLTQNESATLWSHDTDDYTNESTYYERYGEHRNALQQLANGTDITFTRPPKTAATWTKHDFRDVRPGGPDTSRYPENADLENSALIADAHATIFAAQPSTRAHLASGKTRAYLAPDGTLRGLVDYRVRSPTTTGNATLGNTSTEWSLTSNQVSRVWLTQDGETIASSTGTQTPTLDYHLQNTRNTTLTLHARIEISLKQTTTLNGGAVNTTTETDSVTVTDSLSGSVYDLAAYPYYAEYPNGDAGVAIFQSRPWQGYTLTDDGSARVRGVWRFYTARHTNWDTLVASTRDGETRTNSDAIPVSVHAYPSRIGPVAEPVRTGPSVVRTWGINRSSPASTLGLNVHIDVVNGSYKTSYGVAVRAKQVDRQALHVAGIVRGVNATIFQPSPGSTRHLRESNLTASVLSQNDSAARVRLELRDNQTGAPIDLSTEQRGRALAQSSNGYIDIGDQHVETNASGIAVVTLTQPGIYTAQYQPESWLGANPAYVRDQASVRWHPLGTLSGWFDLAFTTGWKLLPFVVMFYTGQRLLRLFGLDRFQHP
ncbi:hypothetical protein EFA46_014885 (plasmid) [Halarchaeum sp. CBA1220]|uniref:hypothetical protein n=1 Tax=Halarchaeum sp. CBA1220 TaxID=1853682 RepID=UPI0015A263AA|nr:hypothetical protein [Halarchaeum sp. CBA1220]QLC35523.1 hypothetical protein EFA46_014885 [Halarchaeum sp. CBA1220]